MPHRDDKTGRRRLAAAFALAVGAGFWLWLAFAVHTMPVLGGELDGYLLRADGLLRGHLVADGMHPFGLPFAIAGVAWCGVDLFTAGRLVGIASGLLLAWASYRVVRHWAARPVAALAAFAVVASEHVLVGAVQACSDVPAAALMAVAVLAWVRAAGRERPAARLLAGGAAALGLAVFVRTPSMAYAPAFLPLLAFVPLREAARRAAWACAGGAVGMAPHVITTWLSRGSLGQNSNQIVWKYRFVHDDAGYHRFLADPEPIAWRQYLEWFGQGLGDLWRFVTTAVAVPWTPVGLPWLTAVASVALVVALLLPLPLRHRAASVPALAGAAFGAAICILSFPEQRLIVPLLLPLVAVGTLGWLRRAGRWPLALAAALALGAAANVPGALDRFERLHARAEMQAAEDLIAERGDWISIALPTTACRTDLPCVFHLFSARPRADEPADAWRRLLATEAARDAQFVVVARRSHPDVHAELERAEPPAGYRRLRGGDVLVFERIDAAPWLGAATVDLDAAAGEVRLALRFAATVDPGAVAGAGFLVRELPDGAWQIHSLARGDDGGYAATLPGDGLRAGSRWQFVPAFLTWHGGWQRAAPIERIVPAGR